MDAKLLDYLQRILNARVYDVAVETPLDYAEKLSLRMGNSLWLKREDTQPVFSFKLRGAYNKMVRLPTEQLAAGVVCASAGNHAQGVALSAQRLRCRAIIVMPVTTPRLKSDAVRAMGGEVILHGESYSDAYEHAAELARDRGLTFVHPFDDPDVIAGQGTIGMEILRQHQHPLHTIFVSVGGGGLLAGVAAYVKAVRPEVRVVGVQMDDSDAMVRSLQVGKRVNLNHVGLFSDGTAVKQVGDETFRLVQRLADDFVIVSTDEVCAAIKDVFEDTRSIVEPAGAMGVAAAKRMVNEQGLIGQSMVAVTCGANINFERLRFVAERAQAGEGREALFAVTIPETPGTFRQLCNALGGQSITEFNYRITHSDRANVIVGVAIEQREQAAQIAAALAAENFPAIDLGSSDVAKDHLRYLIGGPSPLAAGERLYRFQFPERPGALARFLNSMSSGWNISLFHYRNQGADYGRILLGVQAAEEAAFRVFADRLGYPFVDETSHPAYQLLLAP